MSKITSYVTRHWKAFAGAAVTLAAYLVGVIPPAGGFGDVTTVQWLGAVVFVGGAFGVTAAVRNRQPDVLVRLERGHLVAGDGAEQTTGERLSPYTQLHEVTPAD
jgi:hypothetical protein